MNLPPQSDWNPTEQHPSRGLPPDASGHNYWQSTQGWQHGSWQPQSGPPPHKDAGLKWLLITVAVLLVIGISVGATLIFTRNRGGGVAASSTTDAPGDVASANDTGPVSIITDEPTCQVYVAINNGIAGVEANGWSVQRASYRSAVEWTEEQRMQVEAVTKALSNAADQMVTLAKRTPHRAVRELYEQFIAYAHAYKDSVSTYTPADNFLADANVNIGSALLGVCNSITYNATGRSVGIEPMSPPQKIATTENLADPKRLVSGQNSVCPAWVERERKFIADNSAWSTLDANIPGSEWTPAQRSKQLGALRLIAALSTSMEEAGRQSTSPAFEDLAVLAVAYLRGYVSAGDSYLGADSWLSYTGLRINNAIAGACQAVEG
jgi:hypothetical protein